MPKEREVREVLRRLRSEGWEELSGKGSHVVLRKEGRPTISVPTSVKELKVGTYQSIAKSAGWHR